MKNEIALSKLRPGQTAKIVRICGAGPFKKRLLEMGIVPGEIVEKVKLAPLADPAEYIVKNYHVSLRDNEANEVIVSGTD